jgi:outer membrane protein assembly factor BamB
MLLTLVLVGTLLAQSTQPSRPELPDALIGAWAGEAVHGGETSPVVLEFVRAKDGSVWLVVSLPAIHAWRFPVAPVKIADGRASVAGSFFDLDRQGERLTTTLPSELVPKYPMRVTFSRASAVNPPARTDVNAPLREPRWTVDLGAPIWADVALSGQLVIAGADDGTLQAVDADSGRKRWTFKAGGAIRARPAFVGSTVVVQADDGFVYRLDTKTGRERWRSRVGPPVTRAALHDASSRYEHRASSAASSGGRLYVGTHDGRIVALADRTGARIWEFKTGDAVIATPVVFGGRVYCGSFDGNVYALDASTGALLWKHDTGGAVTSAVAVSGNAVIAGSRSYDLTALAAATGSPMWTKYFWFSWVESPATVFKNVAYVGSSDAAKVFAVDIASGTSFWEADAGGSAWGQPAVSESAVYQSVAGVLHYISPHRGGIVAFDRATGRPLWRYAAAVPETSSQSVVAYGFAGSVALGGRFVFAGGLDGRLYAFAR